MAYKLEITERADQLLDQLVNYLVFQKMNADAAMHLLDGISSLYERLVENPYQFPACRDKLLAKREMREALVTDMNYLLIFKVIENVVTVLGIFHELENYQMKL